MEVTKGDTSSSDCSLNENEKPTTYPWLAMHEGMDPQSSPDITHYNSSHCLFDSF